MLTNRNLRSPCNFLIALESACLVLLNTQNYYSQLMSDIGTDLPPILCFAVYFYPHFVTYFTPIMTFVIAIDRYVHIKFVTWYVFSYQKFMWSETTLPHKRIVNSEYQFTHRTFVGRDICYCILEMPKTGRGLGYSKSLGFFGLLGLWVLSLGSGW